MTFTDCCIHVVWNLTVGERERGREREKERRGERRGGGQDTSTLCGSVKLPYILTDHFYISCTYVHVHVHAYAIKVDIHVHMLQTLKSPHGIYATVNERCSLLAVSGGC